MPAILMMTSKPCSIKNVTENFSQIGTISKSAAVLKILRIAKMTPIRARTASPKYVSQASLKVLKRKKMEMAAANLTSSSQSSENKAWLLLKSARFIVRCCQWLIMKSKIFRH